MKKVREVIRADVAALKKAGPIAPFPWPVVNGHPIWISPFGAVPKKYSGKVRVIHDLSAPKDGDSVNAGILDGSLSIASFGHAARAVRNAGRGAWLIKLDVEAAYKQVPVRPEDWHLLGFEFEGKFFYERVLPFGLRSSCKLWELFAAALQFMCEKLDCGSPHEVIHYVDDFLFVLSPIGGKIVADALLRAALDLCAKLGVPMADEKVEGPTTCLTFLGIQLDTNTLEARLPKDRIDQIHSLIVEWKSRTHKSRTHASIREMQSLAGLLNFACACVSPGRIYTRGIINYITRMISLRVGPHAPCKLSTSLLSDIAWWHEFLPTWNGVSLLYEAEWQEAPLIQLFTDACNTGFGAYYNHHWFAGEWSPEELCMAHREERISMPFLEMRALVMAAATWGHMWKGKKITFRCDCMPVVTAFSKQSSRTITQMYQIRNMDKLAAIHGFAYRVYHIVGETNTVADELSRHGDSVQFRNMCPQALQQSDMPIRPPVPTLTELEA
jgi:hypothetical protein